MKFRSLLLFVIVFSMSLIAQAETCESVINDTFDTDGAIPTEWSEYNTTGQVTVDGGFLKFDFTADKPAAYRTFIPVIGDFKFAFDVKSTRNWVKCRVNLMSTSGKYLTSLMIGNDGAKNIQYATTIDATAGPGTYTGSMIDGNYAANTIYAVSLAADFSAQTFDLYLNGVLKHSGIPFLETVEDYSKIDITQIAMYSSEGRFFFDNLILDAGDKDLFAAIEIASSSLESAVLGDSYGNYSQEAADALQAELDAANALDCEAAQADIDAVVAALVAAQKVFDESKIDDPVLKLYAGYDFSGDEQEFRCGYYNGDLGAFDNKAVSFKLDKGYMLCVAQNVNGSGVSKIYVASEADLAINLPADLQKSISFIRVGPWRDVRKKGSSGKSANNDVVLSLESSWFYDWGNGDENLGDCEYVYMNWAGGANAAKMRTFGENMDATHHLAFNEPDGSNQANMTVDKAIEQYAILQASGLRLGAPAVTDGAKGRAWLDEFMPKAIAAGYRIDFLPVHYYKIMGATAFKAWLKDFYDTYQVPIWVTEFNYGDIWASNEKDKTEAQILTNIQAYCEMMDEADFIERYCIFTWQPSDYGNHSVMSVRNPLTLNSVGEYYANHESPIAYTQEVYEQGPNAIGDITTNLDVNIYPTIIENGELFIQLPDNNLVDLSLRIVDITGRLVLSQDMVHGAVDVKHLPKGMYIVSVHSENGRGVQKVYIQ